MFSALNQGSLVYILDKTSIPKLMEGTVQSVSAPKPSYNIGTPSVIDIKCQVNGSLYEYNQIPSNLLIVTYNGGKLTISETKLGLIPEVEAELQGSRQIVDNIEHYKESIHSCEEILKLLNPQFAKDKERDLRLDSLEIKIDKLLNLINNDTTRNV